MVSCLKHWIGDLVCNPLWIKLSSISKCSFDLIYHSPLLCLWESAPLNSSCKVDGDNVPNGALGPSVCQLGWNSLLCQCYQRELLPLLLLLLQIELLLSDGIPLILPPLLLQRSWWESSCCCSLISLSLLLCCLGFYSLPCLLLSLCFPNNQPCLQCLT